MHQQKKTALPDKKTSMKNVKLKPAFLFRKINYKYVETAVNIPTVVYGLGFPTTSVPTQLYLLHVLPTPSSLV